MPQTTASLTVALIQVVNVAAILVLGDAIFGLVYPHNRFFYLIIAIAFGVFNWNRYERTKAIERLKLNWEKENADERRKKFIWIIVYVSILILAIAGAIIIKNRH